MINNAESLKDFIIKLLEEKQADNIMSLDVRYETDLTKYMIFASGRSTKNVSAIAEYIDIELKHNYSLPTTIEGISTGQWVLLDAGEVILNLFYPTSRSDLKIEEMWEKRKKNKANYT
ncbi:MAG: ribosome silencing factor [Rickettsiaceae bacterium]|nr:MAG: ribosome silencing factor [Rickettsiaceae bacterium]